MGTFNRSGGKSSGFGKKKFGGGKSFGGRDGGPTMHRANCGKCGASCEVPFKPSGDRPVFCRTCFVKQDDGGRSKFGGDRFEKPRFGDKQMHDAVCVKCGKNCQLPFRPNGVKPVFCSDCFGKSEGGNNTGGGRGSDDIAEQIKALNFKLDKIIRILTPAVVEEKNARPEITEHAPIESAKEKKGKSKEKAGVKKTSSKKKK
jgi:CxxC-x17-CxxC domain-containing protein